MTSANAGLTPYVALANLSVPRPALAGQPDEKQVDLVMAGETVSLTDAQAEKFLHFRVWKGAPERPLIRLAREQGGAPVPQMLPRNLSGRMMGPPQGARPDPAGSSVLLEQRVPESQEPQPGSENAGEQIEQDALDIAPRTARARAGVTAGAR